MKKYLQRQPARIHKDILVMGFDVTGSTQLDTRGWVALRGLIIPALRFGLQKVGIRRPQYKFQDAGDGGAVIFKRQTSAIEVLTGAIPAMNDFLHYRRPPELDNPVRTRFAMHRDELAYDGLGYGWTGAALWKTFRMLQSPELSDYHRVTGSIATIAVSNTIYAELADQTCELLRPGIITVDPEDVGKLPKAC